MKYKKIRPSFQQKLYQAFKFFFALAGKSDEMDKYFRVEKFSKILHPMHFSQKGASLQERNAFLKSQLLGIELETHAYCNRTCYFCPNAFLNRRDKSKLMAPEVFTRVLNELAAIDFTGEVKMQRYNEPFSNDIIYERVAEARRILPNAHLSFHSNGDYATLEKLQKVEAAGLNEVFVSLYPDYEKEKNNLQAAGEELCHAFLTKIGIQAQEIDEKHSLGRYKFKVGNLGVTVFAFNLYDGGSDRGGALKDLATQVRRSPCMSPFTRIYIDWTGDVFPCCNLRADYPGHKDYILGNAGKLSLADIYFSKTANFMRRHLAGVSEKTGACRTCQFDPMCSNKAAEVLLNKTLKAIGVD